MRSCSRNPRISISSDCNWFTLTLIDSNVLHSIENSIGVIRRQPTDDDQNNRPVGANLIESNLYWPMPPGDVLFPLAVLDHHHQRQNYVIREERHNGQTMVVYTWRPLARAASVDMRLHELASIYGPACVPDLGLLRGSPDRSASAGVVDSCAYKRHSPMGWWTLM